ncbi:MAG: hypothetical protein LQ352_004193 [Teloschistes flavicans]|nr:MAG: hypothetical protein LQ352_004193 [Teloschistes flavicans]
MSRIAGIQRHDDSQPRDSELEPHPKRQTETGPATYMVIERNTAFDLTHGRSRPANEFTSAMVRTLGPAPGQTHFYDCPIDNVQDRGLANALALREFKRYLETYPDCTHHSGRRQNDIPGIPVHHYYIKETDLIYLAPHRSVGIEHITPSMIGNHKDEPGPPLRDVKHLKGRLDTDPGLVNADARKMMDAYRAYRFDCEFIEGMWEDGRAWFVVVTWDRTRRYELEVMKEDKRCYTTRVPQSSEDA